MAATTAKRTTKRQATKAAEKAPQKAGKATKAAKPQKAPEKPAEAPSDAQTAHDERWQAAVKAGACLEPRQRDENGLSNKDLLYRAFIDALVATGSPMTTDEMRAVIPSYSSSKYSSWRNAWQAFFTGGDESLVKRVPKASRDYRPTKAAAKRRTKGSK
jgi:hypothetical protein